MIHIPRLTPKKKVLIISPPGNYLIIVELKEPWSQKKYGFRSINPTKYFRNGIAHDYSPGNFIVRENDPITEQENVSHIDTEVVPLFIDLNGNQIYRQPLFDLINARFRNKFWCRTFS